MDTIKIGKFLKDLRKEKGLTQSEVADHLYVSSKTIFRWENGDGMPDINVLIDIAEFYNITVDELLRGEKINKKDNERTKGNYESKLNAINKYLFTSLGILSSLIILGIILGFVISEEIALILFIFGIIVSSIVYIWGYKDINDKLRKEDNYLTEIKPLIIKKNIFFLDIIISCIVLLVIILNSFLILLYICIIYLIIRRYLKRINKTIEKLKHCLELIIYISSIIVILFILKINYEVSPVIGVGVMVVRVMKGIPLIAYLIDTFSIGILWYKLSAIILQVLSITGLGILFIPKLKHKKVIYIISLVLGIISLILPVIELDIYYHTQMVSNQWFISTGGTFGIIILLIAMISWIICVKKQKKITE